MKILVVDDEKLLVKGIKFNLENDGYEVVTGCDGMDINCYGGYLADQFAEFLGTGVFVSQQGNLVLDEWVIKNHRSHNDRILSVLIR